MFFADCLAYYKSIFSLNTVFDADFYINLIFLDADFCKIFIIFGSEVRNQGLNAEHEAFSS